MFNLKINDRFLSELPADPERNQSRRQVKNACYSYATPRVPGNPTLVHASKEAAALIGLTKEDLTSKDFLEIFSGTKKIDGTDPYAMCYGGHQFGHWAGQLGDGRAINIGEVEHDGKTWALQLKGSGETPYSRTADGLAVLRSSVREHLCSEAMYHLGVPTTRSLSLIETGDEVLRDMMYDGNQAYEKGAVVCRMAPAFIRFGNFEILASRGDTENLGKLTDFTIKHFYKDIAGGTAESYVEFFRQVSRRTLTMVMDWQRVGFVHGVMNTDNMSILGLTIDYGPYGWLEGYEPGWTPNTTDRQNKRYQYGQQAQMAHWNLYQLANALYPLIEATEPLEKALNEFRELYTVEYPAMMRRKLGLEKSENTDWELIKKLEETLQLTETDMTIFFRLLGEFSPEAQSGDAAYFLGLIQNAFYQPEALTPAIQAAWNEWATQYTDRLSRESRSAVDRHAAMNAVNPKYVLRNYMAQLAIDQANEGNYDLIEELYQLLKAPYAEQPESEKWFAKRPEWARHKVGCSMLSCSS